MTETLILDPLVPMVALYVLAGLALFGVALAVWRRLAGWWLRALAAIAILAAVANPSVQSEDRAPLSDIVIALVDESASQRISDRPEQSATALETLSGQLARMPNTELRVVPVNDAEGDGGTELMTALSAALANEPQARIAGIVAITDGRVHDMARTPPLPAPFHTILTGQPEDWDRRLVVSNAPAFAIMGETITLTLRIEDQGAAPEAGAIVPLSISIDGDTPMSFQVPTGQDIELPLDLPHGGMNVVQVMRDVVIILIPMLLILLLIILFPEIALWLPKTLMPNSFQ